MSGQDREPVLTLVLPGLPRDEWRGNSTAHYMVKHRAKFGDKNGRGGILEEVMVAVREQGWNRAPLERCRVKYLWGLEDHSDIDLDNLFIGMKPYLDSLKEIVSPEARYRDGRLRHTVIYGAGVILRDDARHCRIESDWFDSPKDPKTIIEIYSEE